MQPEPDLGQDRAQLAGLLRSLAHWLDGADGDAGWLAALRFGVAGGLSSLGETVLADDVFRKILAQDPDHLWSWIGLIDIALSRGDAAAAAAVGRAGLGLLPGDPLLRRKTAEAVEQAEGADAALAMMGAATDLAPDDLAFVIGLCRTAGRVGEAAAACDRLLALRPGDRVAHLARIEIGLDTGDEAGAVRAAAAAMDHHPAHPEILLRAAQAHHAAGDVAGVAAILARVPTEADFASEFRRLRGIIEQAALPVASSPADPVAVFAELETALARGGAGVEQAVRGVLGCRDLPWYLALRLVERVWMAGADTMAARVSAGFDAAPWPAADHVAFAVEDALLRHGPRAALARARATPVARRDREAAERLVRVLVAAGAGRLAARYARACGRRWPEDALFARHALQAAVACGALGRVQALTLGGPPVPMIDQVELHILAGDLPAAEQALGQIRATDGPLQEALICRPRATRLGCVLNEARILSAAGLDWARAETADLIGPARDFFLPAQVIVQRMFVLAGQGGTARAEVPDTLHLYLPEAEARTEAAQRGLAALRGATRRKGRVHDDRSAPGWLRERIGGDAARAFALASDPEQRADLVMLAALWTEGGLGMSAHQWPGGNLDALFDTIRGAGFFIDDAGAVSTEAMIAPPGHPVIGAALGMAMAACLAREGDHRWCKTGPGVLTRALAVTAPPGDVTLRPLASLRRVLHPHRVLAPPPAHPAQTGLIAAVTAVLGQGGV